MIALIMAALAMTTSSCSSEVKLAGTGAPAIQTEAEISRDGLDVEGALPSPSVTPDPTPSPSDPRALSFPVETATTKPVTNLYIILDNSHSMTVIQEKTAAAIDDLLRKIAQKKLNLNIRLLSTTDIHNPKPDSVTIGYKGVETQINFPSFDSPTSGLGGNSSFADRKIVTVNADTGHYIVEDTLRQKASHFNEGIIELRETTPAATASALTNSASSQIARFGSGGSDIEQPIAVVYRVAESIPEASDERHAFAIITNEDDSTRKSLITGHRSVISPPTTSALRFYFAQTMWAHEYERFRPAIYRDGVLISSGAWYKTKDYLYHNNCATNPNCLPAGQLTAPCTQEQLATMQARITSMGPNVARLIENGECKAHNSTKTVQQLYPNASHPNPACDAQYPGSSPPITYQQEYQSRFPAWRFSAPLCDNIALAPLVRQSSSRVTLDGQSTDSYPVHGPIGTAEVGAKALEMLRQKAGPTGYTVALIANNGVDSCNQTNYDNATRLEQFLLSAVGADSVPSLRNSVCSSQYTAITNGLESFISTAAKSEYPFSGTIDEISQVQITDEDNDNILRTLLPTDYTVDSGKIIFRSGVLAIGEKIKIILAE